jgi:selenide, water dikinase
LLADLLSHSPLAGIYPNLLVGTESSDDAAVYRLNDEQAIVATTDFFLPIVDDPFDFGRIAATNAISDVYAMGGTPLFALALLGMPLGKLPVEAAQQILAGGAAVCKAAGIPIAGGHSIDNPEPLYGLVAIGVVHPARIKRNNLAQAGDVLILAKGIGVGVMGAALKKGELREKAYQQMIDVTTQLNTPGIALSALPGVHAMTDVTGFGLLGHLHEMSRGSKLRVDICYANVPVLSAAVHLAQAGYITGASERNWASVGPHTQLPADFAEWQRKLLCDPQTSGGLLVACDRATAPQVMEIFRAGGFAGAREIGSLSAGEPRIHVA